MKVPALTRARFSGSPVVGNTTAPMADSPKATDPARLTAPSHQIRPCPHLDADGGNPNAIALDTRKAIEPKTSGAQIKRSSCCTERLARRASTVLMLKNSVPRSCTPMPGIGREAFESDQPALLLAGVDRQVVLDVPGRGEEQGPDEEGGGRDHAADAVEVEGQRAQCKTDGADGEEPCHRPWSAMAHRQLWLNPGFVGSAVGCSRRKATASSMSLTRSSARSRVRPSRTTMRKTAMSVALSGMV